MKKSLGIAVLTSMLWAGHSFAQSDAVKEANAREAEAKAQEAAFKASQAKSEAEAAAAKAKFGTLADYTNDGGLTFDSNAGKMEAQLLASQETAKLAQQVVQALSTVTKKPIVLSTTDQPVSFEAYDAFLVQIDQIRSEERIATNIKPMPKQRGVGAATGLPAFTTGLNVLGNLLRSEYKVSGIEWTPDDLILARSIVNAAAGQGWTFYSPSFMPLAAVKANGAVEALNSLEAVRTRAVTRLEVGREEAKAKPKMDYSLVLKAQEDLIKHIDGLNATLRTPDKDGAIPFAVVIRQAQMAAKAREGYVLQIKAHVGGGSAYSRKNFWTFFGGMPFYVSGGSLVSYALFDGATGEVLKAGVLDGVSPYRKARDISDSSASAE